jgi:flagellar hook-basal body complex protein FliE
MSPLSGISPQMLQAYGIMPRPGVSPAEMMPMPVDLQKAGGVNAANPSEDTFSNMLGQFVTDVNAKQVQSGDAVNRLQSGGDVSLHQAVIAMEEASVSFQLMVEVRNKLLESYQELMRLSI